MDRLIPLIIAACVLGLAFWCGGCASPTTKISTSQPVNADTSVVKAVATVAAEAKVGDIKTALAQDNKQINDRMDNIHGDIQKIVGMQSRDTVWLVLVSQGIGATLLAIIVLGLAHIRARTEVCMAPRAN